MPSKMCENVLFSNYETKPAEPDFLLEAVALARSTIAHGEPYEVDG